MKIDGYTPINPKIASEIGVELEYPTKHGKFNIRAKMAGDHNSQYEKAIAKYNAAMVLRKKSGIELNAEEDYKEMLAIWNDTVIIDWSTTVKSEGRAISPNKENFIKLMLMPPFRGVYLLFTEDASNYQNFNAEVVEDAAKN